MKRGIDANDRLSQNEKERLWKEKDSILQQFVDPQSVGYEGGNGELKPDYLLPLDAWFSMIIYPLPEIKIAAGESDEIRELIRKVKETTFVGNPPPYEKKMWPIELDLAVCRNF
jgi:hypothetical protein